MKKRLMGRIVAVEKNVHKTTYLTTGIKKKGQKKFKRFSGGFGTYVTGSDYNGVSIDIKIYIFDHESCADPIDIRDYILKKNDAKIVTSKLLNYVISRNMGKKVVIEETENGLRFDKTQLDVVMESKKR